MTCIVLTFLTLIFLFPGISQPLSPPYLPEAALAVHAAAQLTPTTDHDYVTSMLAAWGQVLMDDLIATVNGNKVLLNLILKITNLAIMDTKVAPCGTP